MAVLKICDENSKFPLYRVDSFTEDLFTGNPAAVCLINRQIRDDLLQSIATEINVSETAFLFLSGWEELKSSQTFKIRWFTPLTEVPLCGHATLAAATVLFREIGVSHPEIEFDSQSGILTASQGEEDRIHMDFPAFGLREKSPSRILFSSLGISQYKRILYCDEIRSFLIHVSSEDEVRNLQPHFDQLRGMVEHADLQGVIVTAQASSHVDFVSRYFAPWVGIDEDPVTGSAHSVLAPYWSEILNKKSLVGYQASQRGGHVHCDLLENNRVLLGGKTVLFFRGNIYPHGYIIDPTSLA